MPSPADNPAIAQAAEALRSGRLVAFPTETVYGLGAHALDPAAVARIYEVKRRPRTSPLIVHVGSIEAARALVSSWPDEAQRLAEAFWPGPLTLVLPRAACVPDIVTAGGNHVGVRMPAHPLALALLRQAGIPVAAPSANRFMQLSPTTAAHVRGGLGADVDLVLDGGPCEVGIESTVVGLYAQGPVLLRPGGISRARIEQALGRALATPDAPREDAAHAAPGMHHRHYSPRTRTLAASPGMPLPPGRGGLLTHRPEDFTQALFAEVARLPDEPQGYARELYARLHDLDARGLDWIAIDLPPEEPAWLAVRDRLLRALAQD